MRLELLTKQSQRAHDRRAWHVDQSAVALAAIEIKDLLKLIQQRRIAFSGIYTFQHR